MQGTGLADAKVDAVVIGRNEGARLAACLQSLIPQVRRVIYVDSGSSDGSETVARASGARVVALDMALPFSAARARNAGLTALADDPPQFVQFVDGDCEVVGNWVAVALGIRPPRRWLVSSHGHRLEQAERHARKRP